MATNFYMNDVIYTDANHTETRLDYIHSFNKSECDGMFLMGFNFFKFNEEDSSVSCRIDKEYAIENPEFFEHKSIGLLIALCELSGLDFYPIGDEFSLGNFDTGFLVHNTRINMLYIISGSDSIEFCNGKEIRIYGRVPDEEDIDYMNEFM